MKTTKQIYRELMRDFARLSMDVKRENPEQHHRCLADAIKYRNLSNRIKA